MSDVTQSIDVEALTILCNLEWLEYDGRPYPAALHILRNHRETAHAAGVAAERERCARVADEHVLTADDDVQEAYARAAIDIAAAIRSGT